MEGEDGRGVEVSDSAYLPGMGGGSGAMLAYLPGIGGGRGFSNNGADVGSLSGLGGRVGGRGPESDGRRRGSLGGRMGVGPCDDRLASELVHGSWAVLCGTVGYWYIDGFCTDVGRCKYQ